jgi:hypothetical protein
LKKTMAHYLVKGLTHGKMKMYTRVHFKMENFIVNQNIIGQTYMNFTMVSTLKALNRATNPFIVGQIMFGTKEIFIMTSFQVKDNLDLNLAIFMTEIGVKI